MTPISIAYSPDTDDAFMVYALKEKLVDWKGYTFEFVSGDIQNLNEKALEAVYDVTAISMALFPSIREKYNLLPIGASIGDRFGPVVVVRDGSWISDISEIQNKRIAIPGKQTSAFFAASELLPANEWVAMPFDEIEPAIRQGQVDGGILIHELQINYESFGLRKLADLGQLWHSRFDLPLPLGGIAIRKNLPDPTKKQIHSIYRSSIEYAFTHREEVLRKASEWAKEGLDAELSEKYIEMYVNEDSLALRPSVQEGIKTLFNCGFKNGLCEEFSFSNAMITD